MKERAAHPRPLCSKFHRASELIGRRWTGAIIFVLMESPRCRFATLRKEIHDITDRMLSERLFELEQEGIVERTVIPESPVRVEYALTKKGRELAAAVDAIGDWAKKWIETYFGDIPSQPQPQHPDLSEPDKFIPRSEVYKDPLARVPAVLIGWPGPPRRSAEYNALVMADVLFTGGDSSRFQLDLVKGKQSVLSYEANPGWPFSGASDYKAPALYAMDLLYNPKFTAKEIVDQVQEEITKVQRDGVDPKELERARTFFRASRMKELQTALNRAQLLAQYEMFDNNPGLITSELDAFLAVTPEQIQAVARKYLTPEKRVVLEIQPAPKEKK